MQVKSITECSKGSILQYFRLTLSYHLSLRLSIFEWPFYTDLTVCNIGKKQTAFFVFISGNACVLKPSEISWNTAVLLDELIPKYFDTVCILYLVLKRFETDPILIYTVTVRLGIEGLLGQDSLEILARYFILCLVLVQQGETGKCPDMTEKLLSGTQSIKTNKVSR